MKNKTLGFSLIEMVITIGIIGLLVSIILPLCIELRKQDKLAKIGIKKDGNFFYDPETKEIVEVNDNYTQITRVIGKLAVSIIQFQDTNDFDKHKLISYCNSPALIEYTNKNEIDEIVVNGFKYRKIEQ